MTPTPTNGKPPGATGGKTEANRLRNGTPPRPAVNFPARRPPAPGNLQTAERGVVGFLVEEWPDSLTGAIAELVRFAPSSFDDHSLGAIVATGRTISESGRKPDLVALAAEHDAGFLANLSSAGPVLAEIDAGTVLRAYIGREAAAHLDEELTALVADPGSALDGLPDRLRALADLSSKASVLGQRAPWDDIAQLSAQDIPTPPALVDGLLRLGEKCVIGGASKSFKSWLALDLALAVSHGRPWLGRGVHQGKALFVNLELPLWCVRSRLMSIARARGITFQPDSLLVWTLRGENVTAEELRARLLKFMPDGLALVVVDPAYKLLQGRDENAAGDIASLMSHFESITRETGASVVVPAHFSKGNQSGKEAMDRVSGSGVFARDPDTLLTMTRHEEDGALVVEGILRTFPPISPFVVRWNHPVFSLDATLDPARLKQAKGGRPPQHDIQDILRVMRVGQSMTTTEWENAAREVSGIGETTFKSLKKEAEKAGKVRSVPRKPDDHHSSSRWERLA